MIDSGLLNDLVRLHQFQPEPNWRHTDMYIYGTGTFARDIHKALQTHEIGITGFIDHRIGESNVFNGRPLLAADDPGMRAEQRRNATVILGIHNREANIGAILENLNHLGFGRVISPIELYDYFGGELGDRYWLTTRTFYASHLPQIETVYDLLSDDVSRATFVSLLRFRVVGNYAMLPEPDVTHQYFSPELPKWSEPIRFVDCGAYDGDTLQAMTKATYQFESIAAFEPDQANFRKLCGYIVQEHRHYPNAILFPCGVYSSTTQLTFETGRAEASALAPAGLSIIQCVSLDECLPTFRPTLIKMDIEGAELEALLGAEKLIGNCQPALAISAYHTPAHLWEIPLLVDRIARQYRLQYTYHLRTHAHNCFDTIFYAIPLRSS